MDYKHYVNIKVVVVVVVGRNSSYRKKWTRMLEFLIFTTSEADRNSSIQLSSHSSHLTSGWQHQGCCLH